MNRQQGQAIIKAKVKKKQRIFQQIIKCFNQFLSWIYNY